MEVILDSSFIVSCSKRKIDFISRLEEEGFKILIPREVLQELKDIKLKVKHDERTAIGVAMELIEKRKIKKVGIGAGKIDEYLIKRGREGIFIASIDKAVLRNSVNKVMISDSKNDILVQRD